MCNYSKHPYQIQSIGYYLQVGTCSNYVIKLDSLNNDKWISEKTNYEKNDSSLNLENLILQQ